MLILLAMPVLIAVAAMHRYLQCYAPSNLLVRRVRARQSGWRAVASLLAISAALLLAMHAVALAVTSGAPGWLNVLVMILAWDAIRFMLLGVSALVRSGLESVTDLPVRRAVSVESSEPRPVMKAARTTSP